MKTLTDNRSDWSCRNIIFFLLIISLPFSFEYHFSASLGTDIPDELLMVLVSFVFLSSWVYRPSLLPPGVLRHPLLLILFLLLGWTLVSILFSTHPLISMKFLLAKSWYIGAFILAGAIVFSNRKNIKISATILILSMLVVVLITLVRHAFYGFQFAYINKALQPFFRNHVNYSAMLVCLIPVSVAVWKLAAPRFKKWLILLITIFMVALFFSYSRGAWLALPFGIAAAWLASKRKLLLAYIVTLMLAGSLLFWISKEDRYLQFAPEYSTTIFHEDFREHWIATYQLKDVSTAERFNRWVAGVRMVGDHWVTGYGPNCFYEEYKPFAVPAFKTWVSRNEEHSTVHNYFLLTAIEQGIPGLLFFLLLTGAMLWYAEKKVQRALNEFDRVLGLTLAAMIAMVLLLNFLSDLIETDKIGSLFFLSIVLLTENRPDDPTHQTIL